MNTCKPGLNPNDENAPPQPLYKRWWLYAFLSGFAILILIVFLNSAGPLPFDIAGRNAPPTKHEELDNPVEDAYLSYDEILADVMGAEMP